MPEGRVTAALRRTVRERAQGCCEYCRSQARLATEPFAVEHIIPRFSGGKTELDNLALSCFGCNSQKYTKIDAIDPATGELVSLFHPRKESWTEHFRWNDDFTRIIGETAIGRATVEALHLNRIELITLRRILRAVGEHPPL